MDVTRIYKDFRQLFVFKRLQLVDENKPLQKVFKHI